GPRLREGSAGAVSALPKRTPNSGGRPIRARSYHSHPRPIRAIDERVRADFVLDIRDIDLRSWPPLQGLWYIAGPNAPCGTVSDFHHMAPIVLFDLHRRSPCDRIRRDVSGAQGCQPSGATARATIRPKGGCADEFFLERRDRSAPLPESNRIPPPRGPDR